MDDQFKRPTAGKKRSLDVQQSTSKRPKVDKPEKHIEDYMKKWIKAFKNIVLHFDKPEDIALKNEIIFMSRILGARVENFFSRKVTHVITSRQISKDSSVVKSPPTEKENQPKLNRQATPTYGEQTVVKSNYVMFDSNNQRTQSIVDTQPKNPFLDGSQQNDLLLKAQEFKMKVWSFGKIYNMLDFIFGNSPELKSVYKNLKSDRRARKEQEVTLKALLTKEKLQGTTERDRSVRTQDFYYFHRNIKYILVEDTESIYRPILIQEYAQPRSHEEPSWPILFACRDERNPFQKYYQNETPFDGKCFASRNWGMREHVNYILEAQLSRLVKQGVITMESPVQKDEEEQAEDPPEAGKAEEDDAYVAASGNSVTITSNTATSQAASRHMQHRDKRVSQFDRRITEHRPKTAHPRASLEIPPSSSKYIVQQSLGKASDASPAASTSRRVSEQSANTSLEQRRGSKSKPIVENGATPTNAAQALLRAREHSIHLPQESVVRRKSNDKFEEHVNALKNRSGEVSKERRVSGSKDVQESPPPKEILATKEARAAFKEVVPKRDIPKKENTIIEKPKPEETAKLTNEFKEPVKPSQPAKASKEEPETSISKETATLYQEMEKLQAKEKHKERLSRRHENLKPGYCEICRIKFDDFNKHVNSNKHKKQSTDPKIWSSIDLLLRYTARPLAKATEKPPPSPATKLSPPPSPKKLRRYENDEKEEVIVHNDIQNTVSNTQEPLLAESTFIQNSQATTAGGAPQTTQSQESSKRSQEVVKKADCFEIAQEGVQPPNEDDMQEFDQIEDYYRDGFYSNYDQQQLQQQEDIELLNSQWDELQSVINMEHDLPKAISHDSITREDVLNFIEGDNTATREYNNTVQAYEDGDGYVEEDQLEEMAPNMPAKETSPETAEVQRSFDVFEGQPIYETQNKSRLNHNGGSIDWINTLTEVFKQHLSEPNDQPHSHHQSSSHSLIEHLA
ncbi:hypothetical protein E3Q10_02100 [Wallemia mellicola]|uniref:DBF4-type domain-containing protein n=1 Tax=Wallemia mellicola TaxID=1708541 RepID=A0A4T0N6M4_9BASI|nr:hypothetical protein E3Q19_02012 [Wallemia mellicola]TIC30384.1 hypothetical protein E3Q10_02100 [Wallemia mellicola]